MIFSDSSLGAGFQGGDSYRVARRLVFGLGLFLPLFYLLRVQTGGDQLRLLLLGWEFYATGDLPPYGTVLSHGGLLPGSLTGLLVGLPMFLSESYRLISVSILLFHILAWWILDTCMRGILTPRERLLYTIFYWLNPWRVYHSLFLWNPNWVFFFAAVHFWTLLRQRHKGSFVASFLQVLSVGLLFELHGSFLALVLLSVALWLRGYQRVHWTGIILGIVVSVAILYPWIQAIIADPSFRPTQGGYAGQGLLKGNPVRTLLYWLRISSFHFSGRMMDYDVSPDLGAKIQAWLGPSLRYFNWCLGVLSVAIVAFANVRVWRIRTPSRFGRLASDASDREWLVGVTRWCLLVLLLTYIISPVTIMHYMIFVGFHLAILPLVFWLGSDDALRFYAPVWKSLVALMIFFIIAQGIGSPMYRKGGHDPFTLNLRVPHPMLDRLGVTSTGIVTIDPEDGVMPEIIWHSKINNITLSPEKLREADAAARRRMKDLERRTHEAGR